jgi:predicted secreted protein
MDPFTGFVLFVMIWWVVLFAVLPFWTRPVLNAEDTPGGWRGVPERPLLLRKLLVTTAVSLVLFAGAYMMITGDVLSFRHGWLAMKGD